MDKKDEQIWQPLNIPFTDQRQSLDEFADLVVKDAISRVNSPNGRLRFIDHTGQKLVPGAVKGLQSENPELFVKAIDEGIVGRAIQEKKILLVPNVQTDKGFNDFKAKIKKKGEKDERWQKYHDETLAKIVSEIAVPIIAGDYIFGVLSVHSMDRPFNREDVRILMIFGSEVAASFLNRRAAILMELSRIEAEMMSVFDLKGVVKHIAEGIRRTVKKGIPNIFLYDVDYKEKGAKSPFQFFASAFASKDEEDLGKIEPRHEKPGLGMEAIGKVGKEDPFIVVEDVENDPRGSPDARVLGIKTTCCLPLVFKGATVGLLYLHFKERHFFTAEEKLILNMFAVSAAVAIKNATTLQTYEELFGNESLKLLEEFGPCPDGINNRNLSFNEKIGYELCNLSKKLRSARGIDEISDCILDEIKKLCTILLLPDNFSKVFINFQRHEGILYSLPNYRDHIVHVFHVFVLGYVLLNRWHKIGVPIFQQEKGILTDANLKTWFIASIQQDIAYPLQTVESWVPRFPKDTLELDAEIRVTFDWSPIFLSEKNVENIEKLTERFLAGTDKNCGSQKKIDFKNWMYYQLLKKHDHGALSSLSLLNLDWKPIDLECAQDSAIIVLLHNYCKDNKVSSLGNLEFELYPLAFVLAFCDAAQEWGRIQIDGELLQRSIDSSIKFKELRVEPTRTLVTLTYDMPDLKKDDLRFELNAATQCVRLAWKSDIIDHHFRIKAVNAKNEELCTVTLL
jgi:GAF domain-containing protein